MGKGKLAQTTFKIKHVTKDWLKKNGFWFSKPYSDEDAEYYAYRFPVCKYVNYTTLECEMAISPDNDEMILNVFDYGTRDRYAPFYYVEFGNYDTLLKKIWKAINEQLKTFGIKIKEERKAKNSDGNQNKKAKRKRDTSNERE